MPRTHRRQVAVIALAPLVSAGWSTPEAPYGSGNRGVASTDGPSFEVCRVPASDSEGSPEPAITLVDVTREGHAARVEVRGDLASLLTLADVQGSDVRVQLSDTAQVVVDSRMAT